MKTKEILNKWRGPTDTMNQIDMALEIMDLVRAVEDAANVIKFCRDELGVPNDEYPAPVANASFHLNTWLKKHGFKDD